MGFTRSIIAGTVGIVATITLGATPALAAQSQGAKPRVGESAVRVRTGPGTNYSILGNVYSGTIQPCWYSYCSSGEVTGCSYTCTSGSGNTWVMVAWGPISNPTLGYMARNCVDYYLIPPN